MLKTYYLMVIQLCFVFSLQAQIKFQPLKIKKPVDTTQQQKQISGSVAEPMPSTPPLVPIVSANTIAQISSDLADSIALPIPDSIVIPLLDFNNQSIQDVLMLLSAPYGINMAIDPNLKARVTLRFSKIKLKDAILFIIRESGYAFRIKNGIIQVFQPASPAPVTSALTQATVQTFSVKDSLLSVDLKSASLDSVIRWIATKTGRNIIPEKGMKGEITAYFTGMPFDKGLRIIFETNGLELSMKEGLYYLIPAGGGFDESSKEKPSRLRYFVSVKNKKISFNVNNAPISDIIKEIARQSDLQVYVYGDISGQITAKVDSASVEEAFESLLRNTSSTYWISRGIYFFADRSSYEKKLVDIIPINYLQAEEVIPLLPGAVASKATIKTIKEYNALVIEASTSDIIDQAKEFVALIDKPIAQILIEAWVVEVKVDKLRQYGVNIFAKTADHTTPATTYYPTFSKEYDRNAVVDFMKRYLNVSSSVTASVPSNFAVQLQALENEGVSNLISRPQIATLNGHTATITIGTTQYYFLQKSTVVPGTNTNLVETSQDQEKIDINMTLSVTPWVSSNNEVTMDITPTFDVPGTSTNPNLPPPVNRRSLNSKVRVKTGEMIILGGLIGETENKSIDKVPFLGSIPILGWLFSTRKTEKSKTQLMIYLIPHVYYGSERSIDPSTIDFTSSSKATAPVEDNKKPVKKQ